MNALSSLALTPNLGRIRHQRKRLKAATVQLITFQLRQDWFALPITAVERVIPLETIYGDARESGIGLTVYQGQELVVIDVAQRIFAEASWGDRNRLQDKVSQSSLDQAPLLLILKAPTGKFWGLPIDSRPVLKRVMKEAIAPLPSEYQTSGKIQCVSSLSVQTEGEPILFLLESSQLLCHTNPNNPQ